MKDYDKEFEDSFMKKRTKKKIGILLLMAVVLLGAGIIIRFITDRGQTQERVPLTEAENELEEVTGVSLKLDGAYLTYADVEEVLERLHLSEYITYEKKSGAKRILRDEWNPIYEKILDYLDSEQRVKKESVLVLGMNEEKETVDTSMGTFSVQGVALEDMKQYRLYITEQKILGIEKPEKKSECTLANVYLKSFAKGKAVVFFCGKEYEFAAKSTEGELKQTVCDLVFEKNKIKEIRKKQDTITGNLITLNESQIEIEGYGKIPLAKRVPVYKIYGTLEEKTFQDIVIGNMDVQYVVGNGKVQAVLLKEPANIKNIRVLLLHGSSPYYENIYLTSEQKIKITQGEEEREAEAGAVLSASEILGDSKEACTVQPADGGKIYLTKADGSRESLGYSGSMELRHSEQGYTIVNKISLEEYICGVLPSEMPEKFQSEALKAQAICARSYACMQMVKGDYAEFGAHVDDSTNYQVYNKNPAGEKSIKAVEDTVGQVLKYKGNVVEAYYYSTSCGHTGTMENWNLSDDKTYGYLQSVWVKKDAQKTNLSKESNFRTYIQSSDEACFDGKTPYFRWSAALDFNQKDENIRNILKEQKKSNGKNITFYSKDGTKTKSLKGFGAVTEVSVKKRGTSGAIKILKLKFENGMALVKNEYNIRRILGTALKEVILQDGSKNTQMTVLPSAYCILDYDKNTKTAAVCGGGFGHGIGMSQYGADGMAQAGYTCEKILEFFYHDVKIESIY